MLRETGDLRRLVRRFGDGNNSHPLIRSMVHNNIRREGPVVLAPMTLGSALRKALAVSPVEIINDIKTSCLRGRRGAGFPTGMNQNLLGRNILGKRGFHFDIRIQMGAGACVCGEETAMISSCEGHRGDPKNRPPFPAQKGYLGMPTTANIVETFCCVARILDDGPGWFSEIGTRGSTGTTLLSVSGDCSGPGVYEVPFGIPLSELLTIVGAEDAGAVQVGGPSDRMVSRAEFHRTICYDDLATGGSAMSFGPNRNILKIALKFLDFFVEESCGYCTPCRVGNVLMKQKLEQIIEGRGQIGDLEHLQEHGTTMKLTSRCGLGQTAARPVLTTLHAFRPVYETLLRKRPEEPCLASFDIRAAPQESEKLAGRASEVFAA
ncbi:MAG: hypothetical protein HY713_04995 [candidate division NC10 bacterium]|nr:hypothetical protein [candidate division NC10 bacterium]